MMKRYRLFALTLILILTMLTVVTITFAQESPPVQEILDSVGGESITVYYDLFGLKAGQTIYVYAESTEFDTYLIFCDIDCVEQFAADDDSGGDFNSALQYTVVQDGDYSIAIRDCCNQSGSGQFRMLVGINAPDVLTGVAQSTGAQIAVPFESPGGAPPPAQAAAGIQEIRGQIGPDSSILYFDLFGAAAGQTIYIYAESSEFDTYLIFCDIDCADQFAVDDDSGGNLNSALQFTIPADGDYSIAIRDCCDETAAGQFRMLVGIGTPEVLTGNVASTGAEIVVPYTPPAGTQPTTDAISGVQELRGSVSSETPITYFDLFGLRAGQTVYLFAESSEFDTFLVFCDIDCQETFAEDDDSGGGLNSALQYTAQRDGDYSIAVLDCCDESVSGAFRLLVSLEDSSVLSGTATPTGAQIAVVYDPDPLAVGGYERVEATDCSFLEERPVLSGPALTRETPNFIIHYTEQGADRADPSFIEAVEKAFEDVLTIQTQTLGWPLPPPDCGEGGDARFDVYIQDTLADNTLGYAQPEGIVVDNPSSSHVEAWAAYSYMVVDNDFAGTGAPIGVMRATTAHEFHHTIQFGYDINDALSWYYEATSTWMETVTFPEDQDATGYVVDLFETPDLCIGHTPPAYDTRLYAEWLLIDSIARDFGTEAIGRLWEYIADVEGMAALYGLLEELGTTPQEASLRFAVRNLLLDYELSDQFGGEVRVEANVNRIGEVVPRQSGVEPLGVDYLLITKRQPYTFAIDQPNLHLYVIGIDQRTNQANVFDLGQGGTVDTTPFTNAYVIIQNTDTHDDPEACTNADWRLTVTDGAGAPQVGSMGEVFDASRFVPAG